MRSVTRNWTVGALLLATGFLASGAANATVDNARVAYLQSRESITLSVSITPNGSVPSHASCVFTANVSGGTPTYHYSWTVNNSPVGSDAQAISYTNNGSAFRIAVTVTDGNSDQASDSNIMSIGGSTCGS